MSVRKKKSNDDEGIPRWFITYSDVITLLMTFFILLLTFASSEPEGFELMQQALFGSGGSSGTIGAKLEALEHDAFVVRVKPTASRLTTHGSEMPPMYSDPVTEAASNGLKALIENNDLVHFERFNLEVALQLYVNEQGEMTEIAIRHLSMLAAQMRVLPLELTLSVPPSDHLEQFTKIAEFMTTKLDVPSGRIGIEVQHFKDAKTLQLKVRQKIQK